MRPWQHVLEPLEGYMALAERLSGKTASNFEKAFNFGPSPDNSTSVNQLVIEAMKYWSGTFLENTKGVGPHESSHLAICSDRAKKLIGWEPRWNISKSIKETIFWYVKLQEAPTPLI